MRLQVVLWFCLLFLGTETFATDQPSEGKDNQQSNSIRDLLSEFSDATTKWNSLYQKFLGMETGECSFPENEILCESFRNEVSRVTGNLDKFPKARRDEVNPVLLSIQEKLEKINGKIESGAGGNPIATRDHINAMKSLERRLRYFHKAVSNLEQEMKGSSKNQESRYSSLVAADRDKLENASGNVHNYNTVVNMTKMCTQLMLSHQYIVESLRYIADRLGGSDSKAAYALRVYKGGLYKNSAFKDIKDMLENISDDIKSLKKMSNRELNENEKILKKINKKLAAELKDDDRDDEELKKTLKSFMVDQRKKLEVTIRKALRDSKNKKDTDDDDDSDDDDDDDSDGDDDSSAKGKRKSKNDTDDDDTDEDCSDSDDCEKSKKRKKGRNGDDSDEDDDEDDDDDSDEDKKKGKKKPRNNKSDDTDDDDDSDDDEDDDDDDDDDGDDGDDSDADGRRNRNKKKSRENLSKNKYLAAESDASKDVEMLKNYERNSAAGDHLRRRMFWKSLFAIPASEEKDQD